MDTNTVFKLLSDETRLRVIILLNQEQLCVCEICTIMDEPQPKISKILSRLRLLNLVETKKVDKYVFYSLNIKDELLLNNIKYISSHIENYPLICRDKLNMIKRDDYKVICESNILRKDV